MKKIYNILGKMNISRRLNLFIILIIIVLVSVNSYQSISTFSKQITESEKRKLNDNISMLNSIIKEKEQKYLGYANLISHTPSLRELLKEDWSGSNILYDLKVKLGIGGLELRNNDFKIVYNIGSGTSLDGDPELAFALKNIMDKNENTSYLTENYLYIQINAISTIMDYENDILGTIIVSEPINLDFLNELASNIHTVVQIYKESELAFTNIDAKDFHEQDFVDDEIINIFINKNKDSLIKSIKFNQKSYLIGYLPIRNHFGNAIGYFTLISSQQHVKAAINRVILSTLINALVFVLISSLIVLFITRSITVPLSEVIKGTQKVASGDLTELVVCHTKDELSVLAENFNSMVSELRSMVRKLADSSQEVYNMSEDLSSNSKEVVIDSQKIAASSEHISKKAEEQAVEINDTANTFKNLKERAKNVNEGSIEVMETVVDVHNKSNEGKDVMEEVYCNISDIFKEIQNSNTELSVLKQKMGKINKIVESINYINEETTILSLNAASEALREGQSGRGFADIVDKIKELASQSNKSLKEIIGIEEEITTAMHNVENSMKNSGILVGKGENAVNNARSVLDQIQETIKIAKNVSGNISNYADEQLNIINTINTSIEDTTNISQKNAEGVKKTAETNQELSVVIDDMAKKAAQMHIMANDLQEVVNKFKI